VDVDFRQGQLTWRDPDAGTLELQGDGFAAAGEIVTLVVNPAVQRWLGMSASETAEAARTVDEYRDALRLAHAASDAPAADVSRATARARAAAEARVAALLGEPRLQRVKSLSWRIRDGDALFDAEVGAALGLDPGQQQALEAARQINVRDARESSRDLSSARVSNAAEFEARATAGADQRNQRLLAVLTPQQRETFDRLKRAGG
jgi:hypothetical protein